MINVQSKDSFSCDKEKGRVITLKYAQRIIHYTELLYKGKDFSRALSHLKKGIFLPCLDDEFPEKHHLGNCSCGFGGGLPTKDTSNVGHRYGYVNQAGSIVELCP